MTRHRGAWCALAGALLLALAAAPGRPAEATFRDAYASAQRKLAARDYAGARTDAEQARALAATTVDRNEALILLARAATAGGDNEGARAAYARVLDDAESESRQKVAARMALGGLWMQEGKPAEAIAEYRRVTEMADAPAASRAQACASAAQALSRQGDYAWARKALQDALALPDLADSQRVGLWSSLARTWSAEGDGAAARAEYAKLAALPAAKESYEALTGAAWAYEQESNWRAAEAEYGKVLARDDLSPAMRVRVLLALAGACGKEGNVRAAGAAVDELLKTDATTAQKAQELSKLADLALKMVDHARAREALSACASLPDLDGGKKLDALLRLAGVCLWQRDAPAARKALDTAMALPGLTAEQQLAARLRSAGLRGAQGDTAAMAREIQDAERWAPAANVRPGQLLQGFRAAAGAFLESGEDAVARAFLARADALVTAAAPREPKVYECRFVPDLPIGAAAWSQLPLVKDPRNRETRFEPYDRQAAENLVADATAQRPEQKDDGAAGRKTWFVMAGDTKGWHIYIQSDDPELGRRLAAGEAGGDSLEMFFAPGLERESYHQWILGMAKGDVNLIEWDTPHPGYHALEGYFRAETLPLAGGWGTHVFIPWECLYDKMPFDGQTWRFGLIRWMAGAVTWGGEVHETGRWGLVHWVPPSPAERAALQRALIGKAWLHYRDAERAATDYWKDTERGDPEFYAAAVEPLIRRCNALAERMKGIERTDGAALSALYEEVPGLMEFDLKVQELRRQYLSTRLLP